MKSGIIVAVFILLAIVLVGVGVTSVTKELSSVSLAQEKTSEKEGSASQESEEKKISLDSIMNEFKGLIQEARDSKGALNAGASDVDSSGKPLLFDKKVRIVSIGTSSCGRHCSRISVSLAFYTDDKEEVTCTFNQSGEFFKPFVETSTPLPMQFTGKGRYLFSGGKIDGLRLENIEDMPVNVEGYCRLKEVASH